MLVRMISHKDLIQVAFSCKWSVLTILAEKSVPVEAPLETALIHHVGEFTTIFSLLHKFNTLELSIKDPLFGFLNIKVIHRHRTARVTRSRNNYYRTRIGISRSKYLQNKRSGGAYNRSASAPYRATVYPWELVWLYLNLYCTYARKCLS